MTKTPNGISPRAGWPCLFRTDCVPRFLRAVRVQLPHFTIRRRSATEVTPHRTVGTIVARKIHHDQGQSASKDVGAALNRFRRG